MVLGAVAAHVFAGMVVILLYWGSGYRNIQGTGNNKVYAFALTGSEHGRGHSDRHDEHSDDQGKRN